jgi:hypothetical protein
VVGQLPDGQVVRAVAARPMKNFMHIETSLNGANISGFASTDFLKRAPDASEIAVVQPQSDRQPRALSLFTCRMRPARLPGARSPPTRIR